MRKLILAKSAAVMLCSAPAVLLAIPAAAQEAPPTTGEVLQVQANPRGAEPVSATPPDPATAHEPVPAAMPADPGYRAGPYKGALTLPPPEAFNKVYPVCTREIQDSCINPSDARSAMRAATGERRRRNGKGG